MNILLLAPHPFFQERGTPIAVNLLLEVLSERGETVDVLTYHEGEDIAYPGVTIHRIRSPWKIRGIAPGFSLKKIVCDLAMAGRIKELLRRRHYDVIHAVEESVFLARHYGGQQGIPYVYDMDSSMPQQIIEKRPFLRFLLPIMTCAEKAAVKDALVVVPMCDALAGMARNYGARKVVVLRDISLLQEAPGTETRSVQDSLGIRGICFMYIGNLESYQGIDLLLSAFAKTFQTDRTLALVIAGGTPRHIELYQQKARTLGVGEAVHFLGLQPVGKMSWLFKSADILVSPRILGNNTPMKIYSYLDSGKAILATDLPTHTQVLSHETACLVAPDPEVMAQAMIRLAGDPELRQTFGVKAKACAQSHYSLAVFRETVASLYNGVADDLKIPKRDSL